MTRTRPDIEDVMASCSWSTLINLQARETGQPARRDTGLRHSDADGGFFVESRYDDVAAAMDNHHVLLRTDRVPADGAGSPALPVPVRCRRYRHGALLRVLAAAPRAGREWGDRLRSDERTSETDLF